MATWALTLNHLRQRAFAETAEVVRSFALPQCSLCGRVRRRRKDCEVRDLMVGG